MRLPFGWLPGHWGLAGSTRDIARIEYENPDPYAREIKVAEYLKKTPQEILEINLKHNKITESEYRTQLIELLDDGYEKDLRTLELLHSTGEITELEYEKEVATLNETPWFHMDVEYVNGELELDLQWNSFYIQMLKRAGYDGSTDEEIIDGYVRDFGRKISDPESDEN